jgi:hypothetical protein
MTWVKLADNWNRHRKMVRLSRDARLLWVDGITYSCEQLTDGFIPDEALPLITTGLSGLRKNNVIRELSSAGLWERVEAGSEPSPGQVAAESGWSLHDFLDWNPSRTEVLTRRRLESARKAKSRGYDGCPAGSHATVVPCDSARSPAGSHAAPVPSRHGNEDPDPDHPATATRTAARGPKVKAPNPETEGFRAVKAAYEQAYLETRGATAPFCGREGKAINDLLGKLGRDHERACRIVRKAFASGWWSDKASLSQIAADPARFEVNGASYAPKGPPVQAVDRAPGNWREKAKELFVDSDGELKERPVV